MSRQRDLLVAHTRPYRRVLAIGCLCAVIEVLAGLAQPWPLKFLVDDVLDGTGPRRGAHAAVALVCLAVVGLVGVAAFMDYWSTRLLASAGAHLAVRMREDLFAHLHRMSLQFHSRHRVGDLAARVTGDIDRSQDMIVQFLAVLVPNGLLLTGMVSVLVVLDLALASLALAVTPLLGVVVYRSSRDLKRASRRARRAESAVAAAASEDLAAMHLVQAYSLEHRQERSFGVLTSSSLTAGLEAIRLQARFSPIVDLTGLVSAVVVLWVGAHRVLAGRLSIGELLVFLTYVGSVYKPLKALSKLGHVLAKGSAASERILDVLAEIPQVADLPGARPAPKLRGDITLRGVCFTYGREDVLDHVDLRIAAGETVALVGPTGSGKSTIASLVGRLADPTAGTVELDGIDIRRLTLDSVRTQVSMVLQDCPLLHGTIRENISLGRAGASAADIDRAARLALVTEFTERLPEGLDTVISERGGNLSGGQRQRIAIARAILRDAPIIVLDEPTSALDSVSEQLIVEALSHLPATRTTLVIAHRLTTIRRADRIVVLERGRIVESGTHSDLLANRSRYFELTRPGDAAWCGAPTSSIERVP